jgi:hypothetical protein
MEDVTHVRKEEIKKPSALGVLILWQNKFIEY